MNWKVIVLGGLAFYVGTFIVGMITGQVIHTMLLDQVYNETASFWRPELNEDPPNMGALMPMWIFNGLVSSFVAATIYGWIRPALGGSGWQKGLSFGVILSLLGATYGLGMSGVFNLPGKIWFWWTIDALAMYLVGAMALGWVAEKFAPES